MSTIGVSFKAPGPRSRIDEQRIARAFGLPVRMLFGPRRPVPAKAAHRRRYCRR